MRILYLGDVIGKAGRDAVAAHLPGLRERLKPDFVILNGENAAHGFGITGKICKEFYGLGVDVVTTGNHVWDQRELLGYIDGDPQLIRPLNLTGSVPGRGANTYKDARGRKIMVIQVIGRLFMGLADDPFAAIERELSRTNLGGSVQAIVVDVHAEATSEKMAMGHALDGRVSMVVGSHSHVPTADTMILAGGTAYQTDAGMCGDYNSVIGMKKEAAIARFQRGVPSDRLEPADGEATVCGLFIETDDRTGQALSASPVRIGGKLAEAVPG